MSAVQNSPQVQYVPNSHQPLPKEATAACIAQHSSMNGQHSEGSQAQAMFQPLGDQREWYVFFQQLQSAMQQRQATAGSFQGGEHRNGQEQANQQPVGLPTPTFQSKASTQVQLPFGMVPPVDMQQLEQLSPFAASLFPVPYQPQQEHQSFGSSQSQVHTQWQAHPHFSHQLEERHAHVERSKLPKANPFVKQPTPTRYFDTSQHPEHE